MRLEFGYGNRLEYVDVPDENLAGVLMSNPVQHERFGADAVSYALEHPVGTPRLSEIVTPGQTVAIITSDISRPLPSYEVLPPVLEELYSAGVKPENITIVIALGSHRNNTEAEHRRLVGDNVYDQVRVVDSNPRDVVRLGTTSAGTPADFDRNVVEANVRICLGNIEFHYFAGYSGGCKAVMPGVSTPEAIQANHRRMIVADAHAGKLEGNPVREDLEEAAAMLGVDFIVNVVLDEHKRIVYAVAGDVVKAHREGCKYLDRMYRCEVSEPADIVIVSQGGAPKDANLYQTQKALDNAKHIVRDGGSIILVGACNEGFGNSVFENWLAEASSPHDLVLRIDRDFKLGGHKAAAIAMVLEHAEIYLVSELDESATENIFMRKAASAQEAFDLALARHNSLASTKASTTTESPSRPARVIAMPYGGSVLPHLAL